jgi:hypothetical protein
VKDGENGTGRIARLELGGEWMCKEVVLRTFLVFVQCVVDDKLEVGGRDGRQDGHGRVSVRHGRRSSLFVQREDTVMASS